MATYFESAASAARTRRGKNSPWTRWDESISGKISRVLRFASIWITKRFTSVRLSRRHGNARWRASTDAARTASLSRFFLELLHSRNGCLDTGTAMELAHSCGELHGNGDSFGLSLVTRVSHSSRRATVFPIPQLGISSFIFFFYLSKGRKILPRIFKQLSHILLLLLSINKTKRDERSLNERDLRSMRV